MSNLPPPGPPSQSPSQPPGQPPVGGPAPEILDASGGTALAESRGGRGGARKGLLVGGGMLGLALVGGGAWAAMSFFSTGAQPSEALPADALGYVSIDLDPSGGQKIEAVRTLNKFPAFKDSVGVSPDDDLRKSLFEKALKGQDDCDVSYDDDIAPWLGDRAAIAAVPGGKSGAEPVVVVQVKDADAAEKGLSALKSCGGEGDESTGWVIDGDWAVVASDDDTAKAAVEDAKKSSLADDADFKRWTGETGDAGIVTMYAAPGAGAALLDGLGDDAPAGVSGDQLRDFQGLAATIRFTDGALEIEGAGQASKDATNSVGSADAAASIASLPEDTAAALGVSLADGWFEKALDGLSAEMGEDSSSLIDEVESSTGLSLPEDVETLTKGGVVLAVGPGLDPEALANSTDLSQLPIALKLSGDPDDIQAVIAKITAAVPGGADAVGTTVDGDDVVVGPDEAYREEVAGDGDLGTSSTYTDVVPDGDSPGVLYVDVNGFDAAMRSLAAGDQEVLDNVAPLRGIGVSSRIDGDVTRFTLKISTDD